MKISEINIYPIKSLGGISVANSIVEDRGLQNDRRLMLVDKNGRFLTQRENPQMAKIQSKIVSNTFRFIFEDTYLSMGRTLEFPKEWNSEEIDVQIWKSKCRALVATRGVNEFFSEILQMDCRLVLMPDFTHRQINENFNKGNEIVSFADGYPFLIIGENSLADLNSKLENEIPMNRFRPNLVVSDAEAFAEDSWKKIKIGSTIFRSTKPCARCVITTIDQKTGISDVQEPLKTLSTYRKAFDLFPQTYEKLGFGKNDVLFGQNLVAENFGGEISIGDKVEIIESD